MPMNIWMCMVYSSVYFCIHLKNKYQQIIVTIFFVAKYSSSYFVPQSPLFFFCKSISRSVSILGKILACMPASLFLSASLRQSFFLCPILTHSKQHYWCPESWSFNCLTARDSIHCTLLTYECVARYKSSIWYVCFWICGLNYTLELFLFFFVEATAAVNLLWNRKFVNNAKKKM